MCFANDPIKFCISECEFEKYFIVFVLVFFFYIFDHFASILHCKKIFSRLVITTCFFISQINLIYLVQITYNFEFLMIKSFSFLVLTHFFQFNELKILRQPGYLLF